MTDGFEVDPASLDRFREGVLADLQLKVDAMRARLTSTVVPAHAYTMTEPGHIGADSHRTVIEGFDVRLGLANQQLSTLDVRLGTAAAEYRAQDAAGSDRLTQAGSGLDGGV